MFRKILVPLQSAYTDETAIQTAVDLARMTDAELVLFYAESVLPALPGMRKSQDDMADYLDEILNRLKAEGVRAQVRTGRGEPAACILQESVACECDLILIATAHKQTLITAILGNTADEIVHKSNIPILIVKAKRSHTKQKSPAIEGVGSPI